MNKDKRVLLNDIVTRIIFGDLLVNVLNINYEPPVPGRYFNTHSHSSYEYHFISQGKGTLRTGKAYYSIGPGTLYLTGPGIYHEQLSDSESPMVEYCINLELKHLDRWDEHDKDLPVQEMLQLKEFLTNTTFWIGQDNYRSWTILEKVIDEYQNPMLGYCKNIECLITQIIINLARCFQGKAIVQYRKAPANTSEKRRRTMDSFFRDIDKSRKAEMLAKTLGVGLRQLERLMLQYYGMTFREKLIKTRMAVAEDLLQNTQMTVEEIAFKTGFSSASHLSRIFSSYNGIPPTIFRRMQ